MRKKLHVLVSVFCCLLFFAGTVMAAEQEVSQKDIEKVVKELKSIPSLQK